MPPLARDIPAVPVMFMLSSAVTSKVLVQSDQGSQFTSIDWAAFLKHHNLEHSMSRTHS